MTVLLIGLDHDLHVDAVLCSLVDAGIDVFRLDPTQISRQSINIQTSIDRNDFSCVVSTADGTFNTNTITGVFCRYALDALSPVAEDPIEKFADSEFLSAFLGALTSIPLCSWINDPWSEARADNKLLQLCVARDAGFVVPRTLITNDPAKVRKFSSIVPRCVIKPLSDTLLIETNGEYKTTNVIDGQRPTSGLFTAPFEIGTISREESDTSCPMLLQEQIEKGTDIRATVVDDRVFAARIIRESSGGHVDFRNDPRIRTEPYSLDVGIAKNLASIIHRLGVRYASCDLMMCDGQIFFLEANVAGNWLWTEREAALPISNALALALC